MRERFLKITVKDAALTLSKRLVLEKDPQQNMSFHSLVTDFCEEALLLVRAVPRIAYKSRDIDFQMVGLGSAHETHSLAEVGLRKSKLSANVFYFGAMRFDASTAIADEWKSFSSARFILPLLMLKKSGDYSELILNYCPESMSWNIFVVHALRLLKDITNQDEVISQHRLNNLRELEFKPNFSRYRESLSCAVKDILSSNIYKKVVLGRRRCNEIGDRVDPIAYFLRLREKSPKEFLFFFDSGEAVFFGASPELLYRTAGNRFFTESLAGTKIRSADGEQDLRFKRELLSSAKDNREHQFVSQYIAEQLKELEISDVQSSPLDVMQLSYVQHLQKTYGGTLNKKKSDVDIIAALHPTPAVSGYEKNWALSFIREHEGFDRGLYAGPIGIVGKDISEFAVGIRSALVFDNKLFVYAACGIVDGSDAQCEWEELNNKERNILGIFD